MEFIHMVISKCVKITAQENDHKRRKLSMVLKFLLELVVYYQDADLKFSNTNSVAGVVA